MKLFLDLGYFGGTVLFFSDAVVDLPSGTLTPRWMPDGEGALGEEQD